MRVDYEFKKQIILALIPAVYNEVAHNSKQGINMIKAQISSNNPEISDEDLMIKIVNSAITSEIVSQAKSIIKKLSEENL